MPILEIAAKFGIYAVMATVLVFALGVVTLRNLFHCALCLAAALIGTAAVYVALRAEFLAGVQILLYVGAVMTVIIFAIMLTEHQAGRTVIQRNHQSIPAFIGLAAFVAVLGRVFVKTPWPVTQKALAAKVSVAGTGCVGAWGGLGLCMPAQERSMRVISSMSSLLIMVIWSWELG